MRNLTLAQALQLNKAQPATNKQSTKQIKNWYADGYYLKANARWCCMIGYKREARKYSTH